jgi:hypothetical protein
MKRGKCLKCGSRRVGRLESLVDAYTSNSPETRDMNQEHRALAALTQKTGWLSSEEVSATVEAFVCTKCGYFEEYVKAPLDFPWEEAPGFSWVQ